MKMESSVDYYRFDDYPLRTCLVYDGEESTPTSNLGECMCGECDFCQTTCSDECDCDGCKENKVNGFYDENLNYEWRDGVIICLDKEESNE